MNKLKVRPKAVILDMDGVIVDSMPYHFIAWYEALAPWGVRISCFDVYCREGERWQETLKSLLKGTKVKPTPKVLNAIFASRKKIFKKYFKRFIFRGAYELMLELKTRGFLLGLVSGTPMVEIKRIMPPRMLKLLDCVVAGNQVKKGKPHPEPYLKAASRLKLAPQECLVIENAPLGIISAKKAGMSCIAVSTSLPAQYLKCADLTIESLQQLKDLL